MNKEPALSVHPSEDELILAIDRELPAARLTEVLAHVDVCWTCRTATGSLEAGIREFVSYRNERLRSQEPPTPAARSRFVAWVNEQSAVPIRQPWFAFWRPYITGAAGLAAFLVAAVYLSHPRTVTANELIERAVRAEKDMHAVQRVRIRSRDGEIIREIRYSRGVATAAYPPRTAGVFRAAGLDPDHPLSAVAFANWRSRLPAHKDEVIAGPSNLTLKTTTAAGPIREARLSVIVPDFRPVAEHLRLDDGDEIAIGELSYRPVTEVAILPPMPAPTLRAPAPKSVQADFASGLTVGALADAEAQLRWQLHGLGLDAGRSWNISRTERAVVLAGTAESDAEMALIRARLQPVTLVRLELTLPAQAAAAGQRTLVTGDSGPAQERRAPLRSLLEKLFPDAGDRDRFVSQTLDSSQQLLGEAAALRGLAQRYDPEETSALSPSARLAVESIARDFAAAISRHAAALDRLLSLAGEPAALPASACAGWRACAALAYPATQRAQERATWLLTDGPASPDQGPALLRELREAYTQLTVAADCLMKELSISKKRE